VVGCCKHGNKLSGLTKDGSFFDQTRNYQLLKDLLYVKEGNFPFDPSDFNNFHEDKSLAELKSNMTKGAGICPLWVALERCVLTAHNICLLSSSKCSMF
jgi:hypothetical protein